MCNSSFITLNHKSFCQKKFEINAQGQKCQNGNLAKNSHFAIFGTFVPVHQFQKFFLQNDLWLSVMKELLHTLAEKVSQAWEAWDDNLRVPVLLYFNFVYRQCDLLFSLLSV